MTVKNITIRSKSEAPRGSNAESGQGNPPKADRAFARLGGAFGEAWAKPSEAKNATRLHRYAKHCLPAVATRQRCGRAGRSCPAILSSIAASATEEAIRAKEGDGLSV